MRNNGELPQYLVRNHHEPIVPRAVFAQVQGERMLRSSMRGDPSALRFGSRHALTGRMRCARCGAVLRRVAQTRGSQILWRCPNRLPKSPDKPVCTAPDVREAAVREALAQAFALLPSHRSALECDARRLWLQARLEQPETLWHARLAKRQMQLRLLLELIDCMTLGAPVAQLPEIGGEESAPDPATRHTTCNNVSGLPAACVDYEQFFLRTRTMPKTLLGTAAQTPDQFDDTTIVRYLKSIVVDVRWFEIIFKPDLSIRVSTPCA